MQAGARIVRIAPGEKTLKNATPVQLQDLQTGDRILVAGKASDDAKSIAAASIVVMKRSDVEARKEEDRQDWQKRGLGGLVKAVDPAAGTATISVTGFGGTKSIVVHTSKDTVVRRYAPDSMKFDDAKPSTLQEIQPGDQLRARGNRNADGTELAAEEIVTGSFRNVAGIVNSVDASAGTMNVQDLLSKKPVQIKITPDSQLHQLPPELAQRIAMRLKAAMAGAMPGRRRHANPGRTPSCPADQLPAEAPGSSGGGTAGRHALRRSPGLSANAQPHARRRAIRSAQRRRRHDRCHARLARRRGHGHYLAEWCGTNSASRPQREPGHDVVTLESGRAGRRRCLRSIAVLE